MYHLIIVGIITAEAFYGGNFHGKPEVVDTYFDQTTCERAADVWRATSREGRERGNNWGPAYVLAREAVCLPAPTEPAAQEAPGHVVPTVPRKPFGQ